MPRSFARHTILVVRAALATDRYGTEVPDWTQTSEHPIRRCVVDPLEGSETFDASGRRVVSRWRVIGPASGDLTSLDRVRHAGELYEIDGEVQRFDSPTGRLAHFEAILKRVKKGA